MMNIGMAMGVISSSRILIRDQTFEDRSREFMYYSDSELTALDPPVSGAQEGSYYSVLTVEGLHIGSICAYNYSRDEVEIGIRIWSRSYWNKGYGTEAVNAFCEWAFETASVKRILLKVVNTNIRAQKCYHKCGFVEFGSQVINGYNMIWMKKERQNLLGLKEGI